MKSRALDQTTREAIAEATYQLATCQELKDQGAIKATLAILQAIANRGTKATREEIRNELAAYAIPFCALEIGSSEEEALAL